MAKKVDFSLIVTLDFEINVLPGAYFEVVEFKGFF